MKQSGGRGQFGVVNVVCGPSEETENTFESKVVGGSVPREYVSPVEQGLREAALRGYPLGFPFVKVRFALYDGKYHDVDSSEMAFKEAGRLAFKEAVARAGVTLLEPWMTIVITAPEVNLGDVLGSLNQRRGQIEKTEKGAGDSMRIYGSVPLAEMFKLLRGAARPLAGSRRLLDGAERVPPGPDGHRREGEEGHPRRQEGQEVGAPAGHGIVTW